MKTALGEPERGLGNERKWYFAVGEVNRDYGPGDAGYLYVEFDDGGQVAQVLAPTSSYD